MVLVQIVKVLSIVMTKKKLKNVRNAINFVVQMDVCLKKVMLVVKQLKLSLNVRVVVHHLLVVLVQHVKVLSIVMTKIKLKNG